MYSSIDSGPFQLQARKYESIHIPGDWLYITNEKHDGTPFLEGENIIYLGNEIYWGVGSGKPEKSLNSWKKIVESWNGKASLREDIAFTLSGLFGIRR